jgi:hypothetical protein
LTEGLGAILLAEDKIANGADQERQDRKEDPLGLVRHARRKRCFALGLLTHKLTQFLRIDLAPEAPTARTSDEALTGRVWNRPADCEESQAIRIETAIQLLVFIRRDETASDQI